MADISKITLPSGTTYDIKDATARSLIDAMSSYTSYIGVTTTALTDGATTTPVKINNKDVAPSTGNIVTYNSKELIWNGSAWQEFGDLSALGDLAYKDNASATYTPAGTVSQPTFTGSAVNYTPAGTVTVDKFTPAGTVSQPTFTGSEQTVSGTTSSVTVSPAASGTTTYTPAGTVSTPDISTTVSTTTVNSITAVGSLPSLTTSVSDETLTIGWSAGTLPTKGSNTTVATGVTASASQPSFTGTGVRLVSAAGTSSTTFTPSGTVSQPTFTGGEAQPTASFSGTQGSITAAGTVSKPTFTGTQATITVS